ncbi:Tim44 domain-containing protein [Azospirillum agricola]|uniref:Tim44 domain-containing protein n=1 Tax=Azospirillum agricola TaxID=1720247 RepID=UPI000A0F00E1|nr:Tim44 domain-containing protein [Azospirillum agricola]SMH56962.1 Predicted lipid-binding transport protein, Tim44 family [Azospirillum lipoferum]
MAIMNENTRPTTVPAKSTTRTVTAVAVALMMALSAGTADARAGKSGSSGSRGARTTEAPAATSTAPNTAAPMERSAAPSPGMQRPAAAAPAQSGGFFRGGGFMSGLMGGLIGAGIGAMLFGGGFFEGLGSFAGILGFILQILLVVFLVRLAMRFFRNRSQQQPATARMSSPLGGGANPAYAGGPLNREAADAGHNPMGGPGGGLGGGSGLGGLMGGAKRRQQPDEIGVQPADYQSFERLLVTVQTAYGREDIDTLRGVTTPEMLSYFTSDLSENSSRGVVNKVSDVTLLQGDLSEAWREGNAEYATVAMRFSLIDTTVERASGRVVDGNPGTPVEATELWTFVRQRGGQWQLSAIQQAR